MLYREWRDATIKYIKQKPMKYKYSKTYDYVEWMKQKYQIDKSLFSNLLERKGTIKLRNLYLKELKEKQQNSIESDEHV